MSDAKGKDTALGVARARFVEGLSRKAAELKGALGLLTATPEADRPREEMRRRLHALYASAQVFRLEPLADALRDAIRRLDATRDERRALLDSDLDALANLAATLPVLGTNGGGSSAPPPRATPSVHVPPAAPLPPPVSVPPARIPSIVPEERPLRRSNTLQGMPKSSPPPPLAGAEPRRATGTFTASVTARYDLSKHADTVISVLVVDGVEAQTQIRAALPPERFEVLSASDPEEALRVARSSAPDVVLAERGLVLRPGVDLIGRLRNDPLTDFVPVVLLLPPGSPHDPIAVRETGADEAISKPIDAELLVRLLARVSGDSSAGGFGAALGDATLEQVADRVAFEVRRGLVSSAEQGVDLKVPLGEGAEVLAAAWAAIARVRAFVAQRSGGRVRFRDAPRRGGPAMLALGEEGDAAAAEAATEVSLVGRRIVVADDDPAVVWFFAGILREEGADVVEAADGAEALALARRRRPDLIVSDILMPNVDGFALLRELDREPALADVPVILLSWKEDYLQRMRELRSGASGYLRKEAGAAQILSSVRDALRPRARLEAHLRAGGEVRGRLERVGILPLLETVAQVRPNARLTVRDAWNLLEVDLREGTIVEATRTATDGSFARGEPALLALLGSTAGRFTIVESDASIRGSFHEPLSASVGRAMSRLASLLDAVSGSGLVHAQAVTFDREVLDAVLRTSPEPMRELVARLSTGDGPRQLVISGAVAPHTLESVLVDLVRRGALIGVRGPDGEDRVAVAAAARSVAPISSVPPRLAPIAQSAPEPEPAPEGLSWLRTEETTGEIVAEAKRLAASGPPPRRDSFPELSSSELVDETLESEPPAQAAQESEDAAPIALTRRSEAPRPNDTLDDLLPPTMDDLSRAASDASSDVSSRSSDAPTPVDLPSATSIAAAVTEIPSMDRATVPNPTSQAPIPPPPPRSVAPPAAAAGEVVTTAVGTGPALPSPRVPGAPPAAREPLRDAKRAGAELQSEDEGFGVGTWIGLLLALAIASYFIYQYVASPGTDRTEQTPAPLAEPGAPATSGEATPLPPQALEPRANEQPAPTAPLAPEPDVSADDLRFGRRVPTILDVGVVVPPGQALLVVEVPEGAPRVLVRVDNRDVGAAPIAMAVAPGNHDLLFRSGDRNHYVSARVEAGQSIVMTAPTP